MSKKGILIQSCNDLVSKAKQLIHDRRKSMNKDIIQEEWQHSHRVIIRLRECKKDYLELISVPLC